MDELSAIQSQAARLSSHVDAHRSAAAALERSVDNARQAAQLVSSAAAAERQRWCTLLDAIRPLLTKPPEHQEHIPSRDAEALVAELRGFADRVVPDTPEQALLVDPAMRSALAAVITLFDEAAKS